MSIVVPFTTHKAALARNEAGYATAWSDYYRASRSVMDRETAIKLSDAHVAYLKQRDAEILSSVAEAMRACHD